MSAVELWKAKQPLSFQQSSASASKWRTVGIAENKHPGAQLLACARVSSTIVNKISAHSPTPIHRCSRHESPCTWTIRANLEQASSPQKDCALSWRP